MGMAKSVRGLSYRPWLVKTVRALGLRPLARKWYYRWVAPPGGFLHLECGGISASFIARRPDQLRALEAGRFAEQRILEVLLRTLQPGDTFYDIGSHVGLFTVFLAKAVAERGRVIAFEPESRSYDDLQQNVKLNRLTNVRLFRKALGDRAGEGKLFIGEVVANFSLIPSAIVGPPAGSAPHQVVDVVEGDSFVRLENLPPPRAVKIDVEGYEYAVLSGLRHTLAQPGCQLLCCEVHPTLTPPEMEPDKVLDLIKSLGFGRIDADQGSDTYQAVCWKP